MSKFKGTKDRRKGEAPQLEMTPMIDVVFQLLIFFIVTLKQQDIISELGVSRPQPDMRPPPEKQIDELLDVMVYNHKRLGGEGFVLKGQQVSLRDIERHFRRLAGYSTKPSVIIKCTGDSPHANLVKLLDVCHKTGLTKISVFSL